MIIIYDHDQRVGSATHGETGSIGGTLFTSVAMLFHHPAIAFNMIMTSARVDIDRPELVDFIKIGAGIFAVILSALTLTDLQKSKVEETSFCFSCIWIVCCSSHCLKDRFVYT